MNLAKICSTLLAATALSFTATAATFTNFVDASIPDANPNGLTSTLDVGGLAGIISKITVSLDIAGQWNGDLYAYLSYDGGGFAVLLNRVGKTANDPFGYGDSGFVLTLDDFASRDIHLYGGNSGNSLTGLWQPDGRNVDSQLAVDTDPRNALLGSFDNLAPNGTWTLFVADMATGYESQLVGWGLEIQTVPEPSSAACFAAGLLLLALVRRPRR
jgi:subtilisin-like proprotein convertase family protein